jgi:predicted nucleic acid-binding protein
MRVVVADYLILIGAINVLPRIFEKVHVPIEVRDELTCDAAPPSVRTWMQQPPQWLEVLAAPAVASEDSSLLALDSGERAAIVLAESIHADLLLIDDRAGAILAQRRGLGNRNAGGVGFGVSGRAASFARRLCTLAENQLSLSTLAHGNAAGRGEKTQDTRSVRTARERKYYEEKS